MLTNGTIAGMSACQRQLYLLLVLAADRRGVSFYGDKRIKRILGCTHQQLALARSALMARELLAYDGATYQLLSLPPDATPTASGSSEPSLPAKTPPNKAPQTTNLTRPPTTYTDRQRGHGTPESVRYILRNLFDRDCF
jgi:hypothetical protein